MTSQVLALLVQLLSGLLLALLSLPVVLRLLVALFTHSEPYEPRLFEVAFLGLLWFLWMLLPILVRRIIYNALGQRNDAG